MDDVFTWGAVALILGPVLAGLAIPVFRWLFQDLTRLLIFILVPAGIYWWYATS